MSRDSFQRYGKTVEVNREGNGRFGVDSSGGLREKLAKRISNKQVESGGLEEGKKRLLVDRLAKNKNDEVALKKAQFEIINKNNPMTDEYHVGIRKPDDIKNAMEAFRTKIDEDEDYVYPDFTKEDGENALRTGKVMVYSSKPIGQGGFVSTSKMMAQDYSGGGKIYSLMVDVDDVAWIDSSEGQYAKLG